MSFKISLPPSKIVDVLQCDGLPPLTWLGIWQPDPEQTDETRIFFGWNLPPLKVLRDHKDEMLWVRPPWNFDKFRLPSFKDRTFTIRDRFARMLYRPPPMGRYIGARYWKPGESCIWVVGLVKNFTPEPERLHAIPVTEGM